MQRGNVLGEIMSPCSFVVKFPLISIAVRFDLSDPTVFGRLCFIQDICFTALVKRNALLHAKQGE